MGTRYTAKALDWDIQEMNAELIENDSQSDTMEVGGRNGYTAIDVLAPHHRAWREGDRSPEAGSGCERMLIGGTPRECLAEAKIFYYKTLAGR